MTVLFTRLARWLASPGRAARVAAWVALLALPVAGAACVDDTPTMPDGAGIEFSLGLQHGASVPPGYRVHVVVSYLKFVGGQGEIVVQGGGVERVTLAEVKPRLVTDPQRLQVPLTIDRCLRDQGGIPPELGAASRGVLTQTTGRANVCHLEVQISVIDPDGNTISGSEQSLFGTIRRGERKILTSSPVFLLLGQPGTLSGVVVEELTGQPIAGAQVEIFPLNSTTHIDLVTTDQSGNWTSKVLPFGRYRVVVQVNGYRNATVPADVTQPVQFTEQISLLPTNAQPGDLTVTVRNARDAVEVVGATVEIRSGIGVTTGAPLATRTTDAEGFATFPSLAAGQYTLLVNANGYITTSQTAVVNGPRSQLVVVSPVGGENDIRIVLTWGADPGDLDSHLTGPNPSDTGRFHVYFGNDGDLNGPPFAALDNDETSGHGPETITIVQMVSGGPYRYSVHDYENAGSTTSDAMARSGAKVEVFRGATRVARFFVPNKPGTLWTVFEMTGTNITPINAMSFQDDSDTISRLFPGARASHSDARAIAATAAGHRKKGANR